MALALAQRVLSFPMRQPLAFGVGFSAAKTSFADYLVQRYVEKREEIDVKRNLTFGLFGLGYLGARAWGRRGAGGAAAGAAAIDGPYRFRAGCVARAAPCARPYGSRASLCRVASAAGRAAAPGAAGC